MSTPDDGFRREARTQCRALTNGLIELERGEADVDELFRVSHSLKGACRSVGLSGAGDVAHAVETMFEAVRAGQLDPDAALVDEAIDAIAVLETAVDGEADEDPAAVAAALTEAVDEQRDEAAPAPDLEPETTSGDAHGDVDDDVAAALDAASEFDDIDALLDETDDDEAATDDSVDGWGMLGDDEPAPEEPAEPAEPAGAVDAMADEATDDDPDPSAVPDDPSAYFEQAKQEEPADESTTDDLQAEIESVSFGEFDEDDDVSIEELLAMDPDDEPAAEEPVPEPSEEPVAEEPTTDEPVAEEPTPTAPEQPEPAADDPVEEPASAASDATATDDEPSEASTAEPEPAVTEVDEPEPTDAPEPEPAVTEIEEPEPAVDETAPADEPEPAVTEIEDSEPATADETATGGDADEDLRAIVERLAEPVEEPSAEEPEPTEPAAEEPEPTPTADEPTVEEPASASGPTIDPEDGLFDGVKLPGTDDEVPAEESAEPSVDDLVADEPTPSEADTAEADATEADDEPLDDLDDVTIPDAGEGATADEPSTDDVTLPGTDETSDDGMTLPEASAEPADDEPLDDLSDVELPDSDAPMDVRMDETLVEFEGGVEGLLDVDPSEVSMPGTAALTIEESALDADRFRPLGAGATPAAVETEQEPLTVAPDNAERLLNLAEELSLVDMRLGAAVGDDPDDAVAEALAQLSSLVGEYQRTVMDVRLTPLASAVERLPAVARDAARSEDKQVRVETEGTDVRLDRSVVERLGDPLGHLVRNAVVHGIETPEAREAAGKPETGTVTVSAERVRDEVVVEVHDDGGGVDIDSVRERAVEAGVVDADTAAALDEDAVLDLLFESGLSTVDEVTEVAGRGVGMDAVAGAVRRVDGDVDVETTPGGGTTVRLTLPVSVALTEVMLVRAGGQRFAVPLSAIEQVSPLPEPRVEDGRETVRRADLAWGSDPAGDADVERPYPLVRLSEAFDLAGDAAQLLWLRPEAGDAALGVEEVIGTREVVVRPYGAVFGPSAAVSGAATVDDETVNVLDPASLAGGA